MRRLQSLLLLAIVSNVFAASLAAQNMMTRFYNANAGFAINRGDFNNDGIPDLVFCSGGLGVTLGNSDGTMRPAVYSLAGNECFDLATGDFNRDGKLDVALVDFNVNKVYVMLGNGNGTFHIGQTLLNPVPSGDTQSITVADFNGDGILDLVVAPRVTGQVVIYLGNGDGTFQNARSVNTTLNGVQQVRAGDFDSDGRPDLAIADGSHVAVLFNNGNLNFRQVNLFSNSNGVGPITPTDVNQDSYTDVLVAYATNCVSNPKTTLCNQNFTVFSSRGKARAFTRTANVTAPTRWVGTSAITAADVNGDGINDVVAVMTTNALNAVIVWNGLRNGQYSGSPLTYETGTDTSTGPLVMSDFNRDGRPDFAVANPGDSTDAVLLNAVPRAPCATSQLSPSVTVCMPSDNTYSISPVHVIANANDAAHSVTRLQIYADNKLVSQTSGSHLDTKLPLANGPHFLVVKAFDSSGASFRSDRHVTVYSGSPGSTCSTGPNSFTVCTPAQGATQHSPVRVFAAGYDDNPATAVQVYIDGSLKYNDTSGSNYVDRSFSLSLGGHLIVMKLWDATGKVFTVSRNITVN